MNGKDGLTRRQALGLGAAGFTFLPSHVLGRQGALPPSEKMNLAFVGCGMAGRTQVGALNSQNIVALCDVDWREGAGRGAGAAAPAAAAGQGQGAARGGAPGGRGGGGSAAAGIAAQYPNAKRYTDWRKMLEELDKQIDGVVVSTPDHTHIHCVIAAMKMGKHVMCDKPLGHSVHETQLMMAAAKKYKKSITDTVIQGHASEDCRSVVEWIRDGAIGDVQEAHFYQYETARQVPLSYYDEIPKVKDENPIPDGMSWDLWIGPAPYRNFNTFYHPNRWRYWYDFGTSKLGDHGPHYIDPAHWALDLSEPATVELVETDPEWDPVPDKTQKYPRFAVVRYEYPKKGKRPALTAYWHHNDKMPPLSKFWKEGERFPWTGGAVIIGTKGAIAHGEIYASKPGALNLVKLYPEELDKSYKRPAKTIPRIATSHWMEWVECAKAGKPTSCDFQFGGEVCMISMLGDIAIRNKGMKLHWDAKGGKFKEAEANKFLQRQYRKGWELPA
jgi:predicted dehydrogenase